MRRLRRPFPPHLAPGPTRHRGRRRHERLRARALLRPGPGRRDLRRLHAGLVRRPGAHPRHRAGVPGPPRARRAAGPVAKEALLDVVDEFTDGVLKSMTSAGTLGADDDVPFDAVHANYWLSGIAGHAIKHQLDLPLVSTFHTLDRVKAEPAPRRSRPTRPTAGPRPRRPSSAARTRCWPRARSRRPRSPSSTAPTPSRIRIVAPGVDHAFFGPGDRAQARRALDLPGRRAAAAVRRPHPAAQGRGRGRAPPWPRWPGRTPTPAWWSSAGRAVPTATRRSTGIARLVDDARPGRPGPLRAAAAPRAAVDLLPGRRRLPGAQPVGVLRAGGPGVGGLRHAGGGLRRGRPDAAWSTTGAPGTWSRSRDPEAYAACGRARSWPSPLLAERLSTGSVLRARRYTWARAAHLLVDIYADLTAGRLVECT